MTACPVHQAFDPFSPDYQADPYAVLESLPKERVFYAPAIDYYVVTAHEDIEAVFRDPVTFSAGAAQLPLVPLVPEAQQILLDGGHSRRWSASIRPSTTAYGVPPPAPLPQNG
jgi:cytochrome P450